MYCLKCQSVVSDGSGFCPICGDTVSDGVGTGEVEVVEVTAELMSETPPEAVIRQAPRAQPGSTALTLRPSSTATAPMLARAGLLALTAWRQPAVRAAVKTGASAVAFSLVMRVVRQAVASPRARRAVTRGMVPSLTDYFQPARDMCDGEYEVIETVVYMRRVVRR